MEPFDDSVPQLLAQAGVHTHLVTDHYHYWEDGGATYHNRFSTYELFRGQEGDPWKGVVGGVAEPDTLRVVRNPLWRQDLVNRTYLGDEADHPQTRSVDAGLEFLTTNADADRWLLWLECFDPHEPFFCYDTYRRHHDRAYSGPRYDWPDYKKVEETPEQVQHVRDEYEALLTMCDRSLGRVLDAMDDHGLWDDTLLIVCTDHGFLLGEHEWYGKNVQPWFDENIHTPLFVWDPRSGVRGERRDALVQTVDLGPTLLDYFAVSGTPSMQGRSIADVVASSGSTIRGCGLFGVFGGHVNVTDGRYVYMRSCVSESNTPLFEHTVMPMHMASMFSPAELRGAELVAPFSFSKGVPLLRVQGSAFGSPVAYGTLLWDLETDPRQESPLVDDEVELRMLSLLVEQLRANEAPPSQYERLGLPEAGDVGPQHLRAATDVDRARRALAPVADPSRWRTDWPSVSSSLNDLWAHAATREVVTRHLGPVDARVIVSYGQQPLHRLAAVSPWLHVDALQALDDALAATPT